MSDDNLAPDGTPLPGIDPEEVLNRLIAYALARAEGTLAILAELDAAKKKRGKRRDNEKRDVYHAGTRSAAKALIDQMTAARAALQYATGYEDKLLIAVHVHQIDAAFTPYNLWGISLLTEHAWLERQALRASWQKQLTPQEVAYRQAFHAAVDEVVPAVKARSDLLPQDITEDMIRRHLPEHLPMIPYSTLTRYLRDHKTDPPPPLSNTHSSRASNTHS
jgi:hypothetical protein